MSLSILSFILPLSVVSAGVLHHREHAYAYLGNPLSQAHLSRFGGQAANYVQSVDSNGDDEAGEKLRVIKITRTYAIPYPVPIPYPKQIPVPVPVTRHVPYPVLHPVAVPVPKPFLIQSQSFDSSFQSAADRLKTAAYFHSTPQHTYAVHQNLDHDTPNSDDFSGHSPPTDSHSHQIDQDVSHGHTGSSISAYSSALGRHSGGSVATTYDDRFGSQFSEGKSLIGENAYSRFPKPFQPSPEYTPPGLNQQPDSQISQYQSHFAN